MNTYSDHYIPITLDETMTGFKDDWINLYGQKIEPMIDIIYYARYLNIILLSISMLFTYFIALKFKGQFFATTFSLMYGLNYLFATAGIRAHSEALFTLTFNAALLFIHKYFTENQTIKDLLFFTFFTGLCTSTKLNGIMLIPIFIIIYTCLILLKKIKIQVLTSIKMLIPLTSVFIFIFLNPFTYTKPIENILSMYKHRTISAAGAAIHNSDKHLSTPISRITKVFENFYFQNDEPAFADNIITKDKISFYQYNWFLIILFIIGFISLIQNVIKKNITAIIIITTFTGTLLTLSYYLVIDWSRYYVHLIFFIIFIQTLGLFTLFKKLHRYFKIFTDKNNTITKYQNKQ